MHPDQALAALAAGKHVLCEKPLARTAAAASRIVAAARSAPGFLMPAMCMRFWPGWAWLKQAVQQQTYGKVLAARFTRLSEMPAWSKQGTYTGSSDLGGALFDLHIHDTDFVQFLFGRPAGVFSGGVTQADGRIDHVMTQYHYPGGPAVYAEGSWLLAKGFTMAFNVLCERATLEFDLARGGDLVQITEPGQSHRSLKCDGPDGYGAEIRYIVDCVAQRQPPAVVTALDGLSALEICEAEEQSINTGALVTVPTPAVP